MSEHIYEDSDMEHERYHVIPFGWQREEVVRCRDCRNGHQTPVRGFRCWHWIELDGNGDPVPADVSPDGYCYLGKRRPE